MPLRMQESTKQVIEDYVIKTTLDMLSRNSIITRLAEKIVEVHERIVRDDSGLRTLIRKRDEAKKAPTIS